MEGKGMPMINLEDGEHSHTMCIIRPIAPHYEQNRRLYARSRGRDGRKRIRSVTADYSAEPTRCRIFELPIPQWYLEKHSETSVETHRLDRHSRVQDAEIGGEVPVPSLKGEEAKEPSERQRSLSPTVNAGAIPFEAIQARAKSELNLNQGNRYVASLDDRSSESDISSDEEEEKEVTPEATPQPLRNGSEPTEDDHPSTTSEYTFTGADPTPVTPPEHRPGSAVTMSTSVSHGPRQLHTRPSTPTSSISSPLALAAPIVASHEPEPVPAMSLEPPLENRKTNGADEVKAHPWLHGIERDKVTTTEAAFIPQVTDPESTDYFDPRGALPMLLQEEDDQVAVAGQSALNSPVIDTSMPPPSLPLPIAGREAVTTPVADDFGSFSYKNLPVLKQHNDDVIRRLKTDHMVPLTHAISESTGLHNRRRSVSHRVKKPPSVVTSIDPKNMPTNPPSPATSTSSIASSPSRASIPPSTPGSAGMDGGSHARKISGYGAVECFKLNHLDGPDRRNFMPSRLRTATRTIAEARSPSTLYHRPHQSTCMRDS
ncbi:rim15, signal transduction response regulator [Marasmius crinis-equi]|uniref:Rim15, signal transduction response regulator n=1 Tax=Marasmius crinis-equi TaxID=585013 RepID=A0ABR3F508_9AGAR